MTHASGTSLDFGRRGWEIVSGNGRHFCSDFGIVRISALFGFRSSVFGRSLYQHKTLLHEFKVWSCLTVSQMTA